MNVEHFIDALEEDVLKAASYYNLENPFCLTRLENLPYLITKFFWGGGKRLQVFYEYERPQVRWEACLGSRVRSFSSMHEALYWLGGEV